MSAWLDYLLVAGIVFGINLLPAFGPPTWAALVFLELSWRLSPIPLIAVGACAAAGGRYVLARATGRFAGRLDEERRANLKAAGDVLRTHRRGSILGLVLFALSPVPSAQLFEAAGLLRLPLVPLTAAFFAGRVISYAAYVGAATMTTKAAGAEIRSALISPAGIALQLLLILGIALLAHVDWSARLAARSQDRSQAATGADEDPNGPSGPGAVARASRRSKRWTDGSPAKRRASSSKEHTMKRRTFDVIASIVGLGLAIILTISGSLLTWAHNFAQDEVHNQLAAQKIYFPPSSDPELKDPAFAAVKQYAGQQLTTGDQAEVYADHFIRNHLKKIGGGQTYAQLSAKALANPNDAALQGQVAAMFKGETLRGLLLNAYAWSKTGSIAGIAAVVAFIGAGVMAILGALGLWHARRTAPEQEIFASPLTGAHEAITT